MLQKLSAGNHATPFKGAFTITRVHPGEIFGEDSTDTAFGPLAVIDHAVMKKGLTIKMHEHVNDEILSYLGRGVMHHRDSSRFEKAIESGKLMMMNAGASFWHEEKVKEAEVEMLQIFVRPNETDLPAHIQFHDKPENNQDWYVMVGPEGSAAPLYVRQQVYILDAHPKAGEKLEVPIYEGFTPFLYVMHGKITVGDVTIGKQEAVTDVENSLPPIIANEDTTVVLFFVDMHAEMSTAGTISGLQKK
ncbi:MAG TPA: pirin family protein [Pseudogracilibacillus sp.]|nr:pirin family protein [Pseudogracilibacillus sp.]